MRPLTIIIKWVGLGRCPEASTTSKSKLSPFASCSILKHLSFGRYELLLVLFLLFLFLLPLFLIPLSFFLLDLCASSTSGDPPVSMEAMMSCGRWWVLQNKASSQRRLVGLMNSDQQEVL